MGQRRFPIPPFHAFLMGGLTSVPRPALREKEELGETPEARRIGGDAFWSPLRVEIVWRRETGTCPDFPVCRDSADERQALAPTWFPYHASPPNRPDFLDDPGPWGSRPIAMGHAKRKTGRRWRPPGTAKEGEIGRNSLPRKFT